MPGVQYDQAHSLQHAPMELRDDVVPDLMMDRMPPPDQHIGRSDHRIRQSVVGFIKRRKPDFEVIGGDSGGDRRMDALRIDAPHQRIVFFVAELIPDCDVGFDHLGLQSVHFCLHILIMGQMKTKVKTKNKINCIFLS